MIVTQVQPLNVRLGSLAGPGLASQYPVRLWELPVLTRCDHSEARFPLSEFPDRSRYDSKENLQEIPRDLTS